MIDTDTIAGMMTSVRADANAALVAFRQTSDDDNRDALLVTMTELALLSGILGEDSHETAKDRAWLVSYAVRIARQAWTLPLNAEGLLDNAAEVFYN